MDFKCDCGFHLLVGYNEPIIFNNKKFDYLSLSIYNHKSEDTGKLYKKPKLLGDVVLIGEEVKKFKKYIEKMELTP